ncbi:porin family protein [Chitinophaga sp. CF418]|uniref:porin family protein n=1 Tax=Chitinophaga sp. CF418 TaxID=1855287 RepID=UPI00091C68F3|nr:porin family protein [Chitinophaga sp. CF418]SHN33248.1 Outer membrane protein beta-barrel domain-containing protein [Chitinophaga sp. CF418]
MKKLLFICLVLLSTKGFSQSFLKRFEFGLKAGANYSNFTNTDFATDPLVGFHAGATVAFKITDNFLVQEEFLFSSQGAKIKGDVFGNNDIKLYYISVPFLAKYRTNSGFYIEAGPQVGMKAKEEVKGLTVGEFAKKLDLAAAGGIGFQSKIGLGIGVRYIYGISKVGDFDITNIKTDFRSNVAQASIFYVF